ncbi:carbohydrate-responsive element-binding protein isoform X2 [Venturia canescens]|uniref:carbohydrate-responsive element-binding protein isoform X2 n=1 Tax=Venturia canescens TaxID=32260 RepID=UPI001C9CA456|nr:carbohydrate-responsive element-binding protein isoform X2 [Venturia canescens]
MQAELLYRKPPMMTSPQNMQMTQPQQMHQAATGHRGNKRETRDSRETIHSGHFMVSDFEAEAQDDEDELAVPVPEEEAARLAIIAPIGFSLEKFVSNSSVDKTSQQLSIETSLNKLFQCMSLAYRQKLTSPKWNRFKGIRLRWKDKIRLNNVIWRCWHMQFILKQNTLVCQFASPLDVDTHNKPEAVVLEGKYWKRKLAAVTAEYKKWRMFYRNKILGWTNKDGTDMLESMDMLDWGSGMCSSGGFGTGLGNSYGGSSGFSGSESVHSMMVDEDYMELMTDTLFSTISSNQPLYFPDPREIARGASLADFIQPSLGPLQPNLDDFMDTLEPLQEFLNSKLPSVPEEEDMFRQGGLNSSNYSDLELMQPINSHNNTNNSTNQVGQMNESTVVSNQASNQNNQRDEHAEQRQQDNADLQNLQYTAKIYTQPENSSIYRNNVLSDNYSGGRQHFEAAGIPSQQVMREKSRNGRSTSRSNRVIQQAQQQQNSYCQNAQVVTYQQQQQPFSIDLQTVQLNSSVNQVELNSLTDASQMTGHMTGAANYGQTSPQPRAIRPLPSVVPQQQQQQPITDSFKIIQQPQQGYKFTAPGPNFNAQHCKFRNSGFKTLAGQPVVTVSTNQPNQSHILLQCRPSGLDLTAPALHPTKLLPRPTQTNSTSDKEEVFAVPKYQMKARNRSRSSSSLGPQRIQPPPLVSAVSDPALNINNNVLLAHLLTNNTTGLYTVSSGPEHKVMATSSHQNSMKHILPMLSASPASSGQQQTSQSQQQQQISSNTTHHIATPITIQTITNSSSMSPNQQQQQQQQQNAPGQVLLPSKNQASQQQQQHQGSTSPSSPKDSSKAHSPQGPSLSPLHSPMSLGSPLSPSRSNYGGKGDGQQPERGQYKEQRRVGHIHAEQKRRYNIKNGFDMLHSLIPQLNQNPNTKLSKAAMLQKGADYIKQLRAERHQLKEEMDSLKNQIECLNTSISNCQSMLPATGAPISRQRTNKMKEMFDEYVRKRTRENWKFWIFSILLEPLMISFNASVSTASIEDLYRSTILWVEQHCSLVDLRPAVLNSLRHLCTATDILSDPLRLPEEAMAAVNHTERRRSTQ